MPTIRTTMQPGVDVVVSDAEYERLLELGVIYDGTPPVEPADTFDLRMAARIGDVDSSAREALDSLYAAGGGAVDSVNGLTGVVVLTKTSVGLGNVDNTSDASKPVSTATTTALSGKANSTHTHVATTDLTATGTKDTSTFLRGDNTWAVPAGGGGGVPTTRLVSSGTGLAGGGDLSADRTLAVSYGSTSGTAVQGNDARVTADQVVGTASIRTIGTGAQQAKAGNWTPAIADLPAQSVLYVDQNDPAGTWPNRPTSRTDVKVIWTKTVVGSSDPAAATSPAVNGAYSKDLVVGV